MTAGGGTRKTRKDSDEKTVDRESGTLPEQQSALQALLDGLAWRACTPSYAATVGPHEYVVRYQTCPEDAWATLQQAIQSYGRREQYLVTGNTFTYLLLGEHRYWTAPGWEVINRAREADVVGKHAPPPATEKRPWPSSLKLELRGGGVTNVDTGEVYDIAAVAGRIPWVTAQTGQGSWDAPPYMPPHQYVVLGRCDPTDWEVLAFVVANHPDSYRAYFRGYQSPTRYLELGDGYRYWRTAPNATQMLNRCTLDSVEPPRRVDQGAQPIKPRDWGAPPWLPRGSGWPPRYLADHPELARQLGLQSRGQGHDQPSQTGTAQSP